MRYSWCRELLPGIAQYARRHTDWILQNYENSPSTGVDGMIGIFRRNEPGCERVCQSGIPLVNVSGDRPPADLPLVTHDNEAVGRLAARHLLDRGLAHFAVATLPKSQHSRQRVEGFMGELKRNGHGLAAEIPDTASASEKRLSGLPRPCGIFAVTDLRARHIERACRAHNIQVPGDICIVGCDNDLVECELCHIPLSSVALDFQQVGYRAAECLHRLMRGERPDTSTILVPPLEVIPRRSTERLRVQDPRIRMAVDFMERHYRTLEDLSEVAAHCHMSPRQLQRRFREGTGSTLGRELRKIRLRHARTLLRETHMQVSEIAYAVGMSDLNRFSKYFREDCGMTPSAYRRRRLAEDS